MITGRPQRVRLSRAAAYAPGESRRCPDPLALTFSALIDPSIQSPRSGLPRLPERSRSIQNKIGIHRVTGDRGRRSDADGMDDPGQVLARAVAAQNLLLQPTVHAVNEPVVHRLAKLRNVASC